MQLTFIGVGYVGLVSGVMMSHLGHQVTCLDLNYKKISKLQKLQSPIFEPGLDDYIKQYTNSTNGNNNSESGNRAKLRFMSSYDLDSLGQAQAVFITVGTPPKPNGEVNMDYIFAAIAGAAPYMQPDCLLVIKSTSPPGTCHLIKNFLKNRGFNFEVVSNPEFLREGSAVSDFIKPDRIIIGTESDRSHEIMRSIYKPLIDDGVKLLNTNYNSSELIKYASNSFLANKIAFINEMANLCELTGADVTVLAEGIGLDKRIGATFLNAGPGFGGSCFPKDILALQYLAKKLKCKSLILDAIIKANTSRPDQIVNKIHKIIGTIERKTLAILGLTYKAKTDDIRNSPALKLIKLLQLKGADINVYDPLGTKKIANYKNINCLPSAAAAAKGVHAVIIATEWSEFKEIDFMAIGSLVKEKIIIDLRNILDAKQLKKLGYQYYSIGKNMNAK